MGGARPGSGPHGFPPTTCLDVRMSSKTRRSGVHHGNTPAAWVTVVLVTLAFVVGTLAIVLGDWTMFWVGVAILVIGAIAGKVMQSLGLGAFARQ